LAEESAEAAFLERSHVGKSSLLDCLLDAPQLARTGRKPGCTLWIHRHRVDATKTDKLKDRPQ
jgi:GTP-binding protein EngB required for normal cell division